MSRQQEYTTYVLAAIRDINPYHEDLAGHAYAVGFLAAQLANIFKDDPILARQFKLAVNQQRIRQGKTPL